MGAECVRSPAVGRRHVPTPSGTSSCCLRLATQLRPAEMPLCLCCPHCSSSWGSTCSKCISIPRSRRLVCGFAWGGNAQLQGFGFEAEMRSKHFLERKSGKEKWRNMRHVAERFGKGPSLSSTYLWNSSFNFLMVLGGTSKWLCFFSG